MHTATRGRYWGEPLVRPDLMLCHYNSLKNIKL